MLSMPETEDASATALPVFPLLAYLDGLMEELRGRLPVALNEWDGESIHQSRVATRRMKAAIDLMKPVLGKKRRKALGKSLRKLRRRLGPLRDADVMLGHLAEFETEHPAAARWMSERLISTRERCRKKSTKQSPVANVLDKLIAWNNVRAEMLSNREATNSLLAESLHLQLDAFAEQAGGLGAEQAARPDPHQLRIAGKALRYTLEMAVVEGHDLPESLSKSFKKMQDALGTWHDYVVLADCATEAALEEQLSYHNPELMNELLELIRAVLRISTDDLAKFKRLWTEHGDAIARAIRDAFPLTRAAGASTTVEQPPPDESATAEPL
jgi:CHAD domain-containing protein